MSAAPEVHGPAECLSCGALRNKPHADCPRCGYFGWACSTDLDEPTRRLLRDIPTPDRRGARRLLTLIRGGAGGSTA